MRRERRTGWRESKGVGGARDGRGGRGTKVVEAIEKGGAGARKRRAQRTFIPCGYTESLPVTKQVGQAVEGANFVWMSLRYGRVCDHGGKCTSRLYTSLSLRLPPSARGHVSVGLCRPLS